MAFEVKPKIFQQSWQDEDLEIFESVFPGRPIKATAFYSWYLPKGQSHKKSNLGFLCLETVLGHTLCCAILNGKFGPFWFSYKVKLQLKWKIKLKSFGAREYR